MVNEDEESEPFIFLSKITWTSIALIIIERPAKKENTVSEWSDKQFKWTYLDEKKDKQNIKNIGKEQLKILEIQHGEQMSKDDIFRLNDPYKRDS